MTSFVKIVGVSATINFLRRKSSKISGLIPQGLKNATIFMQGEVKQSIAGRRAEPRSVDTGRFLNSVDFSIMNKKQAVVFTNLEYAKVLEFGSSSRQGRRHFRNSKARNQKKIIDIMQNKFKSI